jgi:hypothetical protein
MRAPRTSTEPSPPRRRGVRWVLGSLAGLVLLAAVTLGTLGETPGGLLGLPVAPERSLEAAIHDRFAGAGAGDIVVLSDVTGQLYTPDHARFSGDRLYPAIDR